LGGEKGGEVKLCWGIADENNLIQIELLGKGGGKK